MKSGGEYRKCKAKTLFQIKGNPQLDKDSFVFGRYSTYPYFTRTVFNNGILGYVDYLDEAHLIKGNSLAVGMIGMQFFYMKHDFYAGQFTKTAFPKFDGFNEKVALWFISWLNKSSKKFQGVLVRDFESVFNDTELIVPYKNNAVAVDYIEEYIEEFENERIRKLKSFLQKEGYVDCSLTTEEKNALNNLNSVMMKEIPIGDLFKICKGKRLTKADMTPGDIRFIGATAENNGITNKISNDSHIHPSNTITVTYNGSVGEAFYQTEQFWASDDVNVLYSRHSINENLALYYLAPIRKKGKGYAYSFKWTKEKMEKDSIWVPCKWDNNKYVCDNDFMETYISAIKKQYVAFLKREIGFEQEITGKGQLDLFDGNYVDTNVLENHSFNSDNSSIWMAAESFECYKWDQLDQSICDCFGGDKTILVGCYKRKKHFEWIQSHQLYNIRLGNTKGSMEANRKLFESISILVLYELEKPNKLSAFKVTGHQEMGKEELVAMGYPNENPRKNYMTFSFTPLEMDLSSLTEQHLIERLIELNPDVIKGTPVFIEP